MLMPQDDLLQNKRKTQRLV